MEAQSIGFFSVLTESAAEIPTHPAWKVHQPSTEKRIIDEQKEYKEERLH